MNDNNVSEIIKGIWAKRNTKISVLEEKKQNLCADIPRLEEIERAIKRLGPKSIVFAVSRDLQKSKELQVEMKALRNERDIILDNANIDFDYFTPDWDCKKCEDTGYSEGRRCSCLKSSIINMLYNNSNMSSLMDYQNFNTFDLNLYSDFSQNDKSPKYYANLNYKFAKSFCANFSKTYENIFMSGKAGTGKTFLCSCIAKEIIDSGFSVIYMTSYNLISEYNAIKFDKINKNISDYIDCDLLIIDDLGSENHNDYNNSILFQIINDRINKKKPIIISSNYSIAKIQEQYKGRIASRLSSKDFTRLKFIGKDLRI